MSISAVYNNLERRKKNFNQNVKALALLIENVVTGYLATVGFDKSRKPEDKPSTLKNKLHLDTGNLIRSFQSRQGSKVTKATTMNGVIKLTYGSALPYAKIHNDGGVIKATPTKDSRGNNTYKMALFFWAKFYETGKEYFKALALHVQKVGSVTMPKRQYFTKALQEAKRDKALNQAWDQFSRKYL